MNNTRNIIQQAQSLLKQNPRDNLHGLDHHLRVFENAQTIFKSLDKEKQKEVDLDVLEAACMWHDVMIKPESISLGSDGLLQETIEYLNTSMKKLKVDEVFHKKVINAIKHHNFLTKFQMNIESKILFDADKLDALEPIRYKRIIESIKTKKLSKAQTFIYAKVAKIWLKTMRSRYHFDISKYLHDQKIKNLLKDKEALQIAKEFGVDIPKIVN